ncbi:MAG: hypothetical protein GY903_01375, partial [Fuerstiella sp.]|nr:hypothetical protein [Fuerstiella sp.]
MTNNQIMTGGVVNGVAVDSVTLLLATLQDRYGPLGEESRMTAMTEFITFRRQPNERINELLTRFEVSRERAAFEGNYIMTWEGYAITLLRIVGVNDQQLMQLLSPLQGQIPTDEPQFNQMILMMRRMGHIIENQPGNIATALRQGAPGATPTFFAGQTDGQADADTSQGWSGGPGVAAAANEQQTYHQADSDRTVEEYPSANETDTETESDSGQERDEDLWWPDVEGLPEEQWGEALFWAYERTKAKWRRFSNKPTRRIRRFVKRRQKGKGKGKGGKGKERSGTFLAEVYFRGKGKGSSGKGFGRKKNPRDKDGRIMKCSICDADDHFRARCPQTKGKGKSKGSGASSSGPGINLYVRGPLDDVVQPEAAD